MNDQIDAVMKNVGDLSSLTILVSYFFGALPVVATMLTIIWTALRIYEMETVQLWLKKKGLINDDKAG
jgi:hypothetical protein